MLHRPASGAETMAREETKDMGSCRTLHTTLVCLALLLGSSCSLTGVKPRSVGQEQEAHVEQPCDLRSKFTLWYQN